MTATSVCTRAPARSACAASIGSRSRRGADQAVVGPGRQPRPVHLDDLPAAEDPQALVPDPAGGRGDVDAHVGERLDPARREPVAADLLARERGLLEDGDVETGLRQVPGGARAGRTGAHDEDVGVRSGRHARRAVTAPTPSPRPAAL